MVTTESLYDQIKFTLLASELTYAISLMRELGRRKQLASDDDNKSALKLPIDAAEFQAILHNNPKLKGVYEGQNEDAALQFSAVAFAKKRNEKSLTETTKYMRTSIKNFQDEVSGGGIAAAAPGANMDASIIKGSRLVYFNDQEDKGYREQTEMVYGVSVDSFQRRVNVVFRGSRTPADWAANKKFNGLVVPNPVKELDAFANDASLPDEVYIHEGFHEYLHRKDNTPHGIFEILMPILEEYSGYELYVMGHSLGGALASLFAVSAACRNDIPKPVICITHAQPLVGDVRLLQSVRKLEESKNLVLLRTRNCEDGVPAVPAFSTSPNFTYTHIGQELKLYEDDRSMNVKLSRSEKKVKNFVLNFKALVKLFIIKAGQDKQRRAHSLREHFRRLEMYEDQVRSLGDKLEDIYSKTEPVIM